MIASAATTILAAAPPTRDSTLRMERPRITAGRTQIEQPPFQAHEFGQKMPGGCVRVEVSTMRPTKVETCGSQLRRDQDEVGGHWPGATVRGRAKNPSPPIAVNDAEPLARPDHG